MQAGFVNKLSPIQVAWNYGVRLPARFVFRMVGMMALGVIITLRPWIRVRIGELQYTRIGHMGPNMELYLRRRSRLKDQSWDWCFFLSGEPANHQLLTMLGRRVNIVNSMLLIRIYEVVRARFQNSDVWIELPMQVNEYIRILETGAYR